MSNVVHENNFQPSYDDILRHLQIIHGRASSGSVEIAWSPSGDKRALNQAELFDVGDLDRAAERAFELNQVAGVNVYMGAALRKPGTFPAARGKDEDFHAAWALHVDLDDERSVEKAKAIYTSSDMSPPVVVVTGRKPWVRAQLWWMLEDPITDPDAYRAQLDALAAAFHGDTTVTNPSRVMRIGGSVAWPKKDGRVTERTELHTYRDRRQEYDLAEIAFEFPPLASGPKGKIDAAPHQTTQGPLGLKTLNDDGRERYMRDSVLACAREFVGENGCMPTPEELFEVVWPQYSAKTDFSRGGRGADEVMAKCRHTVRRLEQGRIRGMVSLESIVESHRARKAEEPTKEAMQAEAETIASGQAEYPLPLIWYDDIEPNLEANDFVEYLLEDAAMSVVYGESNCGKTFWATDLSMHVAAGLKWRDHAVEQGCVIYVALEGGNGIKNRVAAFKKHHGIKSMPFAVIPSSINMLDPEADTPKLITTILAVAKTLEGTGLPVRMVVIDTLSRALAGGNENASEDMGAVVNSADRVRQATGAHLMFIHHSGKNAAAGARGHSLLRAATDTEIEVTHEEDSPVSTATVTKQREMEGGHEFVFSLHAVTLGTNRRGKDVRSCVVAVAENDNATVEKLPRLSDQEYRALTGVKNALASDGYTMKVANSHHETVVKAEILKREWTLLGIVDRCNASTARSHFKRMKDSLVNKGYIGFWDDHIWLSVASVAERCTE